MVINRFVGKAHKFKFRSVDFVTTPNTVNSWKSFKHNEPWTYISFWLVILAGIVPIPKMLYNYYKGESQVKPLGKSDRLRYDYLNEPRTGEDDEYTEYDLVYSDGTLERIRSKFYK